MYELKFFFLVEVHVLYSHRTLPELLCYWSTYIHVNCSLQETCYKTIDYFIAMTKCLIPSITVYDEFKKAQFNENLLFCNSPIFLVFRKLRLVTEKKAVKKANNSLNDFERNSRYYI